LVDQLTAEARDTARWWSTETTPARMFTPLIILCMSVILHRALSIW